MIEIKAATRCFYRKKSAGDRTVAVGVIDGKVHICRQRSLGPHFDPALKGLQPGKSYTVRWRATSSDGHTGSGVYTFGIGVTPPPPTEAYGSTGPTWTDDAARWAYFVALALLVGSIGLGTVANDDRAHRGVTDAHQLLP